MAIEFALAAQTLCTVALTDRFAVADPAFAARQASARTIAIATLVLALAARRARWPLAAGGAAV